MLHSTLRSILNGSLRASLGAIGSVWWPRGASAWFDWTNHRYMDSKVRYASFSAVPNTAISVDADGTLINSSGLIESAVSNVPRLNYNPSDSIRRLLAEEERENLFQDSLTPITKTVTVANATEYTISLRGSGSIVLSGAGSGTVTQGSPVTLTTSSTSLTCTLSGSVDGVNVELGDFATSTIVTEGASVTRSYDSITRTYADTKTIVIHGRTGFGTGVETLWMAYTNADNFKRVIRNASNEIRVQVTNASSSVADVLIGTVANDTTYKIAARFDTNDVNGALDGSAGTPDTSAAMPSVVAERFGSGIAGVECANGEMGQHGMFDTAENDARLEALAP